MACLHGGGGPQLGEVTCGGSPHLSCKHDQIKMRDFMDRWVNPPKRATSPTLPCKQALKNMITEDESNKKIDTSTTSFPNSIGNKIMRTTNEKLNFQRVKISFDLHKGYQAKNHPFNNIIGRQNRLI